MKRFLWVVGFVMLLAGCGKENRELDNAMHLRSQLQGGNGCTFQAKISADYGEDLYQFTLLCQTDSQGTMTFSVLEPETIQGITGIVDDTSGKLTFDHEVLIFPTLADDQITPVSAPWVMYNTLKSGYITGAGIDGAYNHVVINDSYEEQALQLDFWLDEHSVPVRSEILWQGRRILSIDIEDFVIL